MAQEVKKTPSGKQSVKRASVRMKFTKFALPPIRDALVIGKHAPVGATALSRALEDMTPGIYKTILIEHPTIEAVIVRRSDLKKLPEEEFLSLILRHAGDLMDETDSLHVTVDIEIEIEERIGE